MDSNRVMARNIPPLNPPHEEDLFLNPNQDKGEKERLLPNNYGNPPPLIAPNISKGFSIFFSIMFVTALTIALILLFAVNLPLTSAFVLVALSATVLSALALSITLCLSCINCEKPSLTGKKPASSEISLSIQEQKEELLGKKYKLASKSIAELELPVCTAQGLVKFEDAIKALREIIIDKDEVPEKKQQPYLTPVLMHAYSAAIALQITTKTLQMHLTTSKKVSTDLMKSLILKELDKETYKANQTKPCLLIDNLRKYAIDFSDTYERNEPLKEMIRETKVRAETTLALLEKIRNVKPDDIASIRQKISKVDAGPYTLNGMTDQVCNLTTAVSKVSTIINQQGNMLE